MGRQIYINQLERKYKIVYLHNPKHFNLSPGSLYIENLPDGRKLLCAQPRKHSKQFHRLALLKPLAKKNVLKSNVLIEATVLQAQKLRENKKPFGGLLQD